MITILVLLIQSLVVKRVVAATLLADVRVCRGARFNLACDSIGASCPLRILRVAAVDCSGVYGLIVVALLAGEAIVGSKLVPSAYTSRSKLETGIALTEVECLEFALAGRQVARDVRVSSEAGRAVLALGLCLVEDHVVNVEVGDIAHVEGHDVRLALAGVLV